MRGKEANAGSLRALLVILALLCGNIASHPERSAAQSRDPVALTKSFAQPTRNDASKKGEQSSSITPRDSSAALGMTSVASAFKK